MQKSENIVRYTSAEIDRMLVRGEDQSDYARVDATTEEELEAAIASDDEWEVDWSTLQVGIPGPKQQITVRLDQDVVDWFKATGKGYQTKMNAVLKSYVDAQKRS